MGEWLFDCRTGGTTIGSVVLFGAMADTVGFMWYGAVFGLMLGLWVSSRRRGEIS